MQFSTYFVCQQGYSFASGDRYVALNCKNGQWDQAIPECIGKIFLKTSKLKCIRCENILLEVIPEVK